MKDKQAKISKIVIILCLFICLYTLVLSIMEYLQYRGFIYLQDFSDYILVTGETSRGNIFGYRNLWCLELENCNLLSGYLSGVFLLFALLYRIFSHPVSIFIIQNFAAGLTALPLFYIARERLRNDITAFMIAVSFLLFQPAVGAAVNGIHPDTFSMPIIAFAFLSLIKNRYKQFIFFIVFLLLVRENLALVVSAFGIYIFFKKNKKLGLFLFFLGLLWFAFCQVLLFPAFRHNNMPRFTLHFGHLGNDWPQILRNLVLHPLLTLKKGLAAYWPQKLSLQWYLLSPLLYLPLLAPDVLFISVPVILQIYLSQNHFMPYWRCYYHSPIDPILFIAAIYGLARIGALFNAARIFPRFRNKIILFLSLSIICVNLYYALFESQFFSIKNVNGIEIKRYQIYAPAKRDDFVWEAIKAIPKGNVSSIATTFPYDQVFMGDKRCSLLDYYKYECPDFIFLDALNDAYGDTYRYRCALYLGELLNDPWYEPVFQQHGVYIFRRKPYLPSGDFLKELNNFILKRNLN